MAVTLKSTAEGSTLSVNTFTVSRSNRGGARLQTREQWVIKDVWRLIFTGLKTEAKDELIQFLIDERCSCIEYVNEYGETWEGYISNSNVNITQLTRATGGCNTEGDNRLWRVDFEYEGIKQ